jgi:hypothetical protein
MNRRSFLKDFQERLCYWVEETGRCLEGSVRKRMYFSKGFEIRQVSSSSRGALKNFMKSQQ